MSRKSITEEAAHSKNFEKVKRYYDTGKWSAAMVANAVEKGWITEEEYTEIVGVQEDE